MFWSYILTVFLYCYNTNLYFFLFYNKYYYLLTIFIAAFYHLPHNVVFTGIEHKVIYCIIGNHFFFLEILGIINVNIATNTYYIVLIIYFKILILPVDACIILIIISIAMTKSINYEGSHGAPDKNEMIFIGLLFCYSFFDYVIQPCFYCLMQNGCLYGLVVRLVSFGGLDIFIILIYVEGLDQCPDRHYG